MKACIFLALLFTGCLGTHSSELEDSGDIIGSGDPTGSIGGYVLFDGKALPQGQVLRVHVSDVTADSRAIQLVVHEQIVRQSRSAYKIQFPFGYLPKGDIVIGASVRDVVSQNLCYYTTQSYTPNIDGPNTNMRIQKVSSACDGAAPVPSDEINRELVLEGRRYVRQTCNEPSSPDESCTDSISFERGGRVILLLGGGDIPATGVVQSRYGQRIDIRVGRADSFPSFFHIDGGKSLVSFGTGIQYFLD